MAVKQRELSSHTPNDHTCCMPGYLSSALGCAYRLGLSDTATATFALAELSTRARLQARRLIQAQTARHLDFLKASRVHVRTEHRVAEVSTRDLADRLECPGKKRKQEQAAHNPG